jgi:hypothetical protein
MKHLLIFIGVLFYTLTYSQCYNNNSAFDEDNFFKSYDQKLDVSINSELNNLKKVFQVDVHFNYGIEKNMGGNAEFNPHCFKESCENKCNGTVILGLYCVKETILKKYGENIIIAILAHEFGHAIQSKNNMPEMDSKYPELHADFLAGFYIGQRGLIDKSLLESFSNEFYNRGDNFFYSSDHHGTPDERKCAFLEGYKIAIQYKFNIYEAFSVGIDYLSKLYPCKPNVIIAKYSKKNVEKITFKPIKTGDFYLESKTETLIIKNHYGQFLGVLKPDKPLNLSGLNPGIYAIYPCKFGFLGRLRKLSPIIFQVYSGKTSGFTINKTGLFSVSQYTIHFPR